MQTTQIPQPTFKEAFQFWLKLGFISFGGPAGQIAIMHEFLVEKKKWISESRFLHALNYCMLLPGPEAQQLATYIGWLLHGIRGGIVAGLLFVLPSLFMLLALSIVYILFGQLAWVAGLFYGLKPAVVAIVILAVLKIGKKSLLKPFHYAVAGGSFIAIFFFQISFPVIILVALAIGFMAMRFFPSLLSPTTSPAKQMTDEAGYYLNRNSPPIPVKKGHTWMMILFGVVLWCLPFTFYLFATDFSFWKQLTFFFTQAALVTFGGAYAVLPYVAQVSVEKFHWLSAAQMVDGLALGETTPGPLIMVLVFVGFMAGYQVGGSILTATIALLVTAYYTFLPSFIFILTGAPLVERTHRHERLKWLLSIVTAAVVGVVLNLALYFGRAVAFKVPSTWQPDWFALAWMGISLVALYRYKQNMILWIGVSALAGLLYLSF